jgi:hypothetical protein
LFLLIPFFFLSGLNAVSTMATAIKSSWARMNDEAKLKKLLLIEGLCESLRASIFEDVTYKTWAQRRLGAVMSDVKAGQVKQGSRSHRRNRSTAKASQASARRRTLEQAKP